MIVSKDSLQIVIAAFFIFFIFSFPIESSAFLFKKEKYLAKVGNDIITKEEFIERLKRLHMSDRVGEALVSESSFERVNLQNFLQEVIDNKLMAMEAEGLGLDKEEGFKVLLNTYILNLSLASLRQEEVLDKVKVEDKEIEEYYKEGLKRGSPKGMTPKERGAIKKDLFAEKVKAREREYFAQLREKAKIRIDDMALGALHPDKSELLDKTIADVNGEPILGIDVLRDLRFSKMRDEEVKRQILEGLILHKLLDQEAMKRGYGKREKLKKKIKGYRESLLVDQLKKKVILPTITVEESELKGYYEENKEGFRETDKASLRIIEVESEEKAKEVLEELLSGADFSFLAKERSLHPSGQRGEDLGLVPLDTLSIEMRKAVEGAKVGDLLGPFSSKYSYRILEFRGMERGAYIPFDDVRDEIEGIIRRKRFDSTLEGYLKRLRKAVPIQINQEELRRLEEKQEG